MLKKIVFVLGLLVSSIYAGSLNIAVAANVSYAIDELIAKFNETNPDTKVQVTLGSSGKLTAQIKNGAPYQIFMAANMKFPEALYKEGVAITKPLVYAQGSLAMLSDKKLDFTQGIKLITKENIGKIAIANPQTAPYGTAALEAIKKAGFYDEVKSKFVYAESITQTVAYALTAADVGFIAKSSLYSPKMKAYKENEHWAEVDAKLYTPIDQGIVIIKNASENTEAKAFYDFMLSDKAKAIFRKFGYLVP
ncbi:MAG TPA: molybdate ABC transporter substrate-binding protein [Sulfurospirillum sp. UBA12182]|jgi:molybdate transport system substrate-binding protein|nr:MAG TPA: molybdate ABC transporter substrate-binding protein [Sulfurospirillum sp. UBA12182]